MSNNRRDSFTKVDFLELVGSQEQEEDHCETEDLIIKCLVLAKPVVGVVQ